MRGVVEAGLLFDRQRVHVGADQQARTGAVFEHGDDAVGLRAVLIFAHVLGDGVAQLAQFAGQIGRGLFLVVRELGIAVQMLVGLGQRRQLALRGSGDAAAFARRGSGDGKQRPKQRR